MQAINSKDVAAVMDVVSYEYISAEDAKSICKEFSSTNTMLSDEAILFLKKFYTSKD
ncbi:hypothetical protein NEAUS04_0631 [Nematocida ausubeli]|uniref:Uncharacterized protein n=1 Tax=Nematocida ausubeli (strain ATCC PRA-371 / ERTm2) TaxID=1913371 RepID=H8ZBG2_NEMA1|nr:hypothetical protein NERG_00911 [Nematocida ausubeli]KAI5136305.1 hypothetical protein NEAUS06_1850 [Nematocida ausubeli]KAI5137087.1 hypothetical protein NEAUS07_1809 [Nematocida ausubeli]KAI5149639.1 hypothetical protein NEAUS05_1842 [Nematocida ausubeli]KAI5161641.1 hypothetical protein NEAUS04_0631 [Nematocida ausubeli]